MNNNSKKRNLLPIILSCITVIALAVTIWALFFRDNTAVVLAPDYAPQEEEQNAESLLEEEDDTEKLEQPQGGGAVSLTYSTQVSIDLDKKQANLMFANPSKSNQDMVVQIAVKDEVIVQSGILKPGNKVTTLDLIEGSEKKLAQGGYDGKFVILYYNQESGEKAMINTEIPLKVEVICAN